MLALSPVLINFNHVRKSTIYLGHSIVSDNSPIIYLRNMHLLETQLIGAGEQTIRPWWLVTSRQEESRGNKADQAKKKECQPAY